RVILFVVPPPYRTPDKAEYEKLGGTPLPDLNSELTCHYLSMGPRDAWPADRVIVESRHRDIVNFTNEGDGISFTVAKDLEQSLLSSLRKFREDSAREAPHPSRK